MQRTARIRLAFLIVPALLTLQYFVIGKKLPGLYPALTMPSGAGVARQRKRLNSGSYDVYAVDERGQERELDVKLLLRDLPVQYHNRVLARHFGLSRRLPESELNGARAFLAERAAQQIGSRPQAIVFRRVNVTVVRGSPWSSEPKLTRRTLSAKRYALGGRT